MTIRQHLQIELKKAAEELGLIDIEPKVDYPADSKYGDYSSNIAMVASKKIGKNPMEIAEQIAHELRTMNVELKTFDKVEVVKPGFINFWISNDTLIDRLIISDSPVKLKTSFSGKKILVEFAHPNTHKAFHIGHLRNIVTGESVVRLLKAVGANVIRGNYQGDVGRHIAQAIYGLLQIPDLDYQLKNLKDVKEKIDFLGKAYAAGSKAYEADGNAKKEIGEINKKNLCERSVYLRNLSSY